MENKIIKIGIMGCADIAKKSFIPAIKNLYTNFELIAVSSRSYLKAKSFADEFNCIPIEGYDKLLKSNIDAVYIPLPTGMHDEWVNKAILAGKHVYAEKSIAFSLESALQMVNNAKSNNLALMEGYMFQFHPQHKVVKDLLKNNTIGEVRTFWSSFGFPPLQEENFRYNNLLGGGALYDAGGYTVKSVLYLLGDDFQVVASNLNKNNSAEVDIYGNAMMVNKKGVAAHISFGFDNFYKCTYEVWGSLGKITVNKAFTPQKDEVTKILLEVVNSRQEIIVEPYNHFVGALLSFHNQILKPSERENQYHDILNLSKSLEAIKNLNKINFKS